MADSNQVFPLRRFDSAELFAGARPHADAPPETAPTALLRGMFYALVLSSGFWLSAAAIGLWFAV